MGFLTRKKATATVPAGQNQPAPLNSAKILVRDISGPMPVLDDAPTSELSAMSIRYDGPSRTHEPSETYISQHQGYASTSAIPTPYSASRLARAVEANANSAGANSYLSLKDLRANHPSEEVPRRPLTGQSERKSSAGTARGQNAGRLSDSRDSYGNGNVSAIPRTLRASVSSSSLPTSHKHHQDAHNNRLTNVSSASPLDAHIHDSQHTSSSSSYRPDGKYGRRHGSVSSASSYAASETSDVLYNEANAQGRSSSGGTTATTPGMVGNDVYSKSAAVEDRSKQHFDETDHIQHTHQQPASVNRPMQAQIDRVAVPAHFDARPKAVRPLSEISTATMSDASRFGSPALSQTSSMIRKTASRYALSDFNFIRTLGTGSFGRVHLVRSCHNTRFYAIKVLNKERVVKMKQVEHTNSEREMLERVRHPFLVNLWGTFKDCKNLYMVMDFVSGGELFSLLRKSQVSCVQLRRGTCIDAVAMFQRFPDPVAKFFAAEVALALDYLHSLDIIYRDLKPENILLAADGHVKVTDFGFAKYVPDITWTLCGTPDYLAPEVVQSKGYNKSVDWYALGVLIFEMLVSFATAHVSLC